MIQNTKYRKGELAMTGFEALERKFGIQYGITVDPSVPVVDPGHAAAVLEQVGQEFAGLNPGDIHVSFVSGSGDGMSCDARLVRSEGPGQSDQLSVALRGDDGRLVRTVEVVSGGTGWVSVSRAVPQGDSDHVATKMALIKTDPDGQPSYARGAGRYSGMGEDLAVAREAFQATMELQSRS